MPQAGTVPLPRGHARAAQGMTLGGQNGIVSWSRAANAEGRGPVARPALVWPRGGQHGPLALRRFLTDAIYRLPRLPMPWSYVAVYYDRRFHQNVQPLAHMVSPMAATTGGTLNRADGPTQPASPIPMSARFRVFDWYTQYDNRVNAPYHPPEAIQQPVHTRKPLAGATYVMGPPFVNRLTRWVQARSFGSNTPTIGTGNG